VAWVKSCCQGCSWNSKVSPPENFRLTSKSDTGTYTYGHAGGAGPHQLQAIAASYGLDPRTLQFIQLGFSVG
jgi:hypothetical protein